MTIIKVLPHPDMCPNGAEINAEIGISVCTALLNNHIEIEHACDQSLACTTCHVIVREGFVIDICDFAVGLSRQLHGLTIASERPAGRPGGLCQPGGRRHLRP